ncbi:Hypothetical predicted protein, partial [Pelobates cultripes]
MATANDELQKISFSNWLKERKKLLGYELHHYFLIEYQRLNRIPRALRINLRPAWFSTDKEFCAEFEGILKKCSLKLMALTMEQLVKEIEKCRAEIIRQEEALVKIFTADEWKSLKEKSEDQLNILRLEIGSKKLRKFMRDDEDYRKGKVYKWTEDAVTSGNSSKPLDLKRPRLETIDEETASEVEYSENVCESYKEPSEVKPSRRGRRLK